ncbi:gamma-glutamylcyclotransferase [Aureimonas fodinaquatilis]|uniref:Gamma-glutamylcyclotransferase n=1 Tax=Aureimonas fodinaquatilis TaxID=2565783 RepID=A0A5B0DVY8_9HYPH|nr:gamma-glutamylcyclotransferase family protein [Aureimonas fodinaquatilis]KAA0970593.1 gamma-glutamylcyclotransferase [Aureimonas fodinaquatilis]
MNDFHADHPDLQRLIAEGQVVSYFGYGSLVNKRTLRTRFLAIRRAEITGWQRFWIPRPHPMPALLSVREQASCATQGVVVYELAEHLPLVDEREIGYLRQVVDRERVRVENPPGLDVPLFIYEGRRDTPTAEQAGGYILQSYLDAVLQGFHALYGREGVMRFVRETEGFGVALLGDRAEPRYPRSVQLEPGEADFFDALFSVTNQHIDG